jgi:hypothetical protein
MGAAAAPCQPSADRSLWSQGRLKPWPHSADKTVTPGSASGLHPTTVMPMGAFSRLFKPLTQAATAFFRHDLAFKRGSAGAVEIVLEPRLPDGRRPDKKLKREDEARRKARAELDLAVSQLSALLDELPETRGTLKQLVFLEDALRKKGFRALHKLPTPILQKSLEQLEGLVLNWSPAGLANLRSKLAVALIDREHHDPEKEADAYRTAAVMEADDNLPPVPNSQHPEVQALTDDEALAAAYAALGNLAPSGGIEFQGELGSRSAKALAPAAPRPTTSAGEIELLDVDSPPQREAPVSTH